MLEEEHAQHADCHEKARLPRCAGDSTALHVSPYPLDLAWTNCVSVGSMPRVAEIDRSVLAARAAQTHGAVLGPCTDLDLGLAEDLPLVLADASLPRGA